MKRLAIILMHLGCFTLATLAIIDLDNVIVSVFCFILSIILLALVAFYAAKTLARRSYLAAFCGAGVFVFTLALYGAKILNTRYNYIDLAETYLFPARYENCMAGGVVFDQKYTLSVCNRSDSAAFSYTKTTICDTSDQIVLEPSRRSPGWVAASQSLQHRAPFGLSGFTAKKLRGHFYIVKFYDNTSP